MLQIFFVLTKGGCITNLKTVPSPFLDDLADFCDRLKLLPASHGPLSWKDRDEPKILYGNECLEKDPPPMRSAKTLLVFGKEDRDSSI